MYNVITILQAVEFVFERKREKAEIGKSIHYESFTTVCDYVIHKSNLITNIFCVRII